MKILYAIQGTGNGHIARAQEIVPILRQFVDVDLLVSGNQSDLTLPWQVKYKLKGMGFIFGKKGGIDIRKTFTSNSLSSFFKEVWKLAVDDYDLVISDFEPVSAWACKLRRKKCIGISHQSAILNPNAPRPEKRDLLGIGILRFYAPVNQSYGFHFAELDETISTPVIRSDVRKADPVIKGHYTVYLPAYDDMKIIAFLAQFSGIKWEVFSKHSKHPYSFQDIKVQPVNQSAFTKSMLSAKGVFCNAGFETPAEALFLKKKLCVIPMKGQYEQQCNAAMLKSMGVTVIYRLKDESTELFGNWLKSHEVVKVDYSDKTQCIIKKVLEQANSYSVEYFPVKGDALVTAG